MQCEQARTWIPSHAGGDLAPAEAGALRAHLEACPACRALADAYAADQAWLRASGAPAFPESTLDSFRRDVLAAVNAEARPARRWWPRLAFAFAGALLLLAAFVGIARWRRVEPRHETETATIAPPRVVVDPPAPIPTPEPRVLARHRPRPTPTPVVAASDVASTDDMLRIELQTEDPNIRIIWFTPRTQPNSR